MIIFILNMVHTVQWRADTMMVILGHRHRNVFGTRFCDRFCDVRIC